MGFLSKIFQGRNLEIKSKITLWWTLVCSRKLLHIITSKDHLFPLGDNEEFYALSKEQENQLFSICLPIVSIILLQHVRFFMLSDKELCDKHDTLLFEYYKTMLDMDMKKIMSKYNMGQQYLSDDDIGHMISKSIKSVLPNLSDKGEIAAQTCVHVLLEVDIPELTKFWNAPLRELGDIDEAIRTQYKQML